MIKLFAVGFARETDELQLNELFSQHGLVKTLTIVRDQQTGVSKGYAFVQMLDQAGADRAIERLNNLELNGRVLSVRYAASPQRQAASGGNKQARQEPFRAKQEAVRGKSPRRRMH